jgi:hypothetical protein
MWSEMIRDSAQFKMFGDWKKIVKYLSNVRKGWNVVTK